jgi:hypothetical protein
MKKILLAALLALAPLAASGQGYWREQVWVETDVPESFTPLTGVDCNSGNESILSFSGCPGGSFTLNFAPVAPLTVAIGPAVAPDAAWTFGLLTADYIPSVLNITTFVLDTITTGVGDGVLLNNRTDSTSGAPVHNAPMLRELGSVWATGGGGANQDYEFRVRTKGTSAAVGTAAWALDGRRIGSPNTTSTYQNLSCELGVGDCTLGETAGGILRWGTTGMKATGVTDGVNYTNAAGSGAPDVQINGASLFACPGAGYFLCNLDTIAAAGTNTCQDNTETTVYTKTIAAGTLGTNHAVDLELWGNWVHPDTTGQILTVRVKFGGTTYFADATDNNTTAGTKRWRLRLLLSGYGTTSAQYMRGQFSYTVQESATTGLGDIGTNGSGTDRLFGGTPAKDTTSNQDLVVTLQWTNATASLCYQPEFAKLTYRP